MTDQPIRVRRKSQQPFAMVPHTFARDGSLSDKAFRLWIVLQSHADFTDRDCKLYQSTLGAEIGGSQRTVARAQVELVERGLLEVESGKQMGVPNAYVLVDNSRGVSHPRRTPYDTHEIPPKTPVSYKENENPSNKRSGPTDFPEADPDVAKHVAGVRALLVRAPVEED